MLWNIAKLLCILWIILMYIYAIVCITQECINIYKNRKKKDERQSENKNKFRW